MGTRLKKKEDEKPHFGDVQFQRTGKKDKWTGSEELSEKAKKIMEHGVNPSKEEQEIVNKRRERKSGTGDTAIIP